MGIFRDIWKLYRKNVSVEPIVFLALLSIGIVQVTNIRLYFDKLCNHGSSILDFDAIANETVCSDLLHNEASEGAVERSVIKLMRISLGIQAVPKILLSLYLASWSDSFQTRKAVIVLANVGIFAGPLIKLALANIEDLGTADYLLLESFQELTGGLPVLLLGSFAYICDVSSPLKRTTRLAFVEGGLILALAIGSASGTALWNNYGYNATYATSATVAFVALVYSIFLFKEKRLDGDRNPVSAQKAVKGCLNPKNVWKTLGFPFESHGTTKLLWILFFLFAISDLIGRGEVAVDLTYARDSFGFGGELDSFNLFWSTFYAIFVTWSFLALVIMVPVLSQVLDVADPLIMILGALGAFMHSFIFLVARDLNALYSVSILNMFGLSGLVAIRSTLSKLVPPDDVGKAFGMIATLQSIVDALTAEYYLIYEETPPEWHKGFVYCLNATVQLVVILPLSYFLLRKVRSINKRDPNEIPEAEPYELAEVETDIRGIATMSG